MRQVFGVAADEGLGFATAPITVTPSLWPLWEDAIVVTATGLMRSQRLGLSLNASVSLFNATLCETFAANKSASAYLCADGDAASLGSSLNASWFPLQRTPTAVLAAVVSMWESAAIPNASSSDARSFSLTLTGASLIALRAPHAVFQPAGINITLGDAACPILAVSPDGKWVLLQTPTPMSLCGSETIECGYATLRVATSPSPPGSTPAYHGASLTCPPVCPGTVNAPASVPAVTASSGGDAVLASLVTDPVSGALSVVPRPSAASASQGIFYSLACAQVGLDCFPHFYIACSLLR